MIRDCVVVGPLMVNCYILGCEKSGEGIIIDPGDNADKILDQVAKRGLRIGSVVNTHGHFDHVGGNRKVLEVTGAKLLIHELDVPLLSMAVTTAMRFGLQGENSPAPDRFLNDGDLVTFGDCSLRVIHTPGHTRGGCSLHVDGMVFTGDTLFADSIGRTDLPGGSSETLVRSIQEKLLVLPAETIVFPGHGPESTIGHERDHNPYLRRNAGRG